MKTISLTLTVVVLVFVAATSISYATETVELPDAGILPDSKLFTLELWWEGVQRFFTFDSVKKAELESKLAMKRIAEAEKLIEQGKTELAEKHLLQFENRLAAAYEKTEKANEKGKDVDALIEKLEANQLRQQEVLATVYDKVPESAQEGILNAMEKSAKGLQNAMENIQKSEEAKAFKTKLKNTIENFGTTKKNEIKEKLIEKGVISNGDDED